MCAVLTCDTPSAKRASVFGSSAQGKKKVVPSGCWSGSMDHCPFSGCNVSLIPADRISG